MNELELRSRPDSHLKLMDKLKGRGRDALHNGSCWGKQSQRLQGRGKRQAAEPTLSPLPDTPPLLLHSGPVELET